MDIKRLYKWAADIVVTHHCDKSCRFCCDKFCHTYTNPVSLEDVAIFLEYFDQYDGKYKEINDVMLLGGEPTMVGLKYLTEICNMIHQYGWKVSLTTNNRMEGWILALDGYVDYLNISHYYREINPDGMFNFVKDFEKSEVVLAKLINFTTFNDFKVWQQTAKDQGFDFKYSTYNVDTPKYLGQTPEWVDKELIPSGQIEPIFGVCKGMNYNGSVIKFMHLCEGESGYPKLYPNGHMNRTWENEDNDEYCWIDYF